MLGALTVRHSSWLSIVVLAASTGTAPATPSTVTPGSPPLDDRPGTLRTMAADGLGRPFTHRRLALAAIVAVGVFVRLWHINTMGYNSDEAVYGGQGASLAHDPRSRPSSRRSGRIHCCSRCSCPSATTSGSARSSAAWSSVALGVPPCSYRLPPRRGPLRPPSRADRGAHHRADAVPRRRDAAGPARRADGPLRDADASLAVARFASPSGRPGSSPRARRSV